MITKIHSRFTQTGGPNQLLLYGAIQTWHKIHSAETGQKLLRLLCLNIEQPNSIVRVTFFLFQNFRIKIFRGRIVFLESPGITTVCSVLVFTLDAVIQAQKAATYRYKIQNSKNIVKF